MMIIEFQLLLHISLHLILLILTNTISFYDTMTQIFKKEEKLCFLRKLANSLILEHCVSQVRGLSLATMHCSGNISPQHVLHKLSQLCTAVSSNKGRVYVPNYCERLVMYFKDLNLARNDKWGSNMLVAFLQQVSDFFS